MHLQTSHPIAAHTVDHLHPRGTKNDNSTNLDFNRKLIGLVGTPRVMDLGCAGGGFVESILEMGGIALGIEGSDYSKRTDRAAWSRVPASLCTADIARPFLVLENEFPGASVRTFNVATMWEVLEHLSIEELEAVNVNIHAHIGEGYFFGSVHTAGDPFEGFEYHATVRPFGWWVEFFTSRGWKERADLVRYFDPDWVRGPNTDGPGSFGFAFAK